MVSALSFRDKRPGAVTSGQVCRQARSPNVMKIADRRNPVSKPLMMARRLCWIPVLAVLGACSARKPPPAAPDLKTPARLAEADRLVRAGCLDCLVAAFGEYDLLRAIPSATVSATAGATRTAALIALRERELGHLDEGYLQRARTLAQQTPGLMDSLGVMLDVIDAMPDAAGGATRTPTSDVDLDRMRRLRINGEAWRARLVELAATDELAAYTYLSFACATTPPQTQTVDQIVEPVGALSDTALIAFKRGNCRVADGKVLAPILEKDPRFLEVKYFQAHLDIADAPRLGLASKLDDAEKLLGEVYAWRTEWPALTQSIANLAMTAEDYDRAITFYTRTLDLEPKAVDAMLGRVKALTFMGRSAEAIAQTD